MSIEKVKTYFSALGRERCQKARMLNAEKVTALTGQAIGGVCPFANPEGHQLK